MANESNFAFSSKIPAARTGKVLAGVQSQDGDPQLYSWDVPNTGQIVFASGGSYNVTRADRGKLLVVVNSSTSFLVTLPDPSTLQDPSGLDSFEFSVANVTASGASGVQVTPSGGKKINGIASLQIDAGKGVRIFAKSPDGYFSVNGLGTGTAASSLHKINCCMQVSSSGSTGFKAHTVAPNAGTIVGWELVLSASGSCQFTVKKGSDAGYPTTTSIVASSPPSITNGRKIRSTSMSGWTLTFAQYDVFEFYLDSVSGAMFIELNLFYQ